MRVLPVLRRRAESQRSGAFFAAPRALGSPDRPGIGRPRAVSASEARERSGKLARALRKASVKLFAAGRSRRWAKRHGSGRARARAAAARAGGKASGRERRPWRAARPRRVKMAGLTGLEPATSCVTGRRSNQLNYNPAPLSAQRGNSRNAKGRGTIAADVSGCQRCATSPLGAVAMVRSSTCAWFTRPVETHGRRGLAWAWIREGARIGWFNGRSKRVGARMEPLRDLARDGARAPRPAHPKAAGLALVRCRRGRAVAPERHVPLPAERGRRAARAEARDHSMTPRVNEAPPDPGRGFARIDSWARGALRAARKLNRAARAPPPGSNEPGSPRRSSRASPWRARRSGRAPRRGPSPPRSPRPPRACGSRDRAARRS